MKIAEYSGCIEEGEDTEKKFSDILSEIAEEVGEMEELSLRGNGLTSKEIGKLADTLSSSSLLRRLDISRNNFFLNDLQAVDHIKKIILEHPMLEYIDLSYTKITNEGIKSLLENNSVAINERLLSLNFNLSCNRFTEEVLKIVGEKLSPSSALSLLGGNFIGQQPETVNAFRNSNLERADRESAARKRSANSSVLPLPGSPLLAAQGRSAKRARVGSPNKDEIVAAIYGLSDEAYAKALPQLLCALQNASEKPFEGPNPGSELFV